MPPWMVNVEMDGGLPPLHDRQRRRHRRHAAHPLPVDGRRRPRPRAARGRPAQADRRRGVRPATRPSFAAGGGIPTSVLEHPDELTAEQARDAAGAVGAGPDVVDRRARRPVRRRDVAGRRRSTRRTWRWSSCRQLTRVADRGAARRAAVPGRPPVRRRLDDLRERHVASSTTTGAPACGRKAQTVMAALSGWLLPRGTAVEVNRDAYVQPEPLERAQTAQILQPHPRRARATRR